ncbi:hypothetical protein EC991_006164 [Linnemannia zychae]|nr:hypothetical protein EC991_006164 [Linnemannia zychae]
MGLSFWFPFIRRKSYNPAQLYQSIVAKVTLNRRRRLDVLGTCYRVIRRIYSNNPPDLAHRMLEKEVSRSGKESHGRRARRSTDRAERTTPALDALESRLDNGLRIRKRHFVDVRLGLISSFYWSRESRLGFAQYMQNTGWTAKVVDTEADLAIASDAEPDGIVISNDLDMMAHASIQTLWRPVSGGVILAYTVPDLLKALGVTHSQLTALAVTIESPAPLSSDSESFPQRPPTASLEPTAPTSDPQDHSHPPLTPPTKNRSASPAKG